MILTKGHISSGNVADFPWLVNGHYSGGFVISPSVEVITRYFTRLDPVLNSHFSLVKPVTLNGDFEITMQIYSLDFNDCPLFQYSEDISNNRFNINSSGVLVAKLDGVFLSFGGVNPNSQLNGKLNTFNIIKVGDSISVDINGSSINTLGFSGSVIIDEFNVFGDFYLDGLTPLIRIIDKSGVEDVVINFEIDLPKNGYTYSDKNPFGEELVVNGDFSSESGWVTVSGSIVENGVITLPKHAASVQQQLNVTLNSFVEVVYEVLENVGGLPLYLSSTGFTDESLSISKTVGIHKHIVKVINTSKPLKILTVNNDVDEYIVIDNVSVREIQGNALEYINIPDSNVEQFQLSDDATQWDNISPLPQELPSVIEISEQV